MAILALPLSKAKARKCLLLFSKHRPWPGANRRRLRHYNYAYVGEYQFSPSASPLLLPRPPGVSTWRSIRKRSKTGSTARMILASLCFCGAAAAEESAGLDGFLLPPPLPRTHESPRALGWAGDGDEEEIEEEEYGDEEVDGRAERFIERFYEEMRLQQQQQQSSLTHRLL